MSPSGSGGKKIIFEEEPEILIIVFATSIILNSFAPPIIYCGHFGLPKGVQHGPPNRDKTKQKKKNGEANKKAVTDLSLKKVNGATLPHSSYKAAGGIREDPWKKAPNIERELVVEGSPDRTAQAGANLPFSGFPIKCWDHSWDHS